MVSLVLFGILQLVALAIGEVFYARDGWEENRKYGNKTSNKSTENLEMYENKTIHLCVESLCKKKCKSWHLNQK